MTSFGNVIEPGSSPNSRSSDEVLAVENSTKPHRSLVDHFEVMVDHLKQQALQLEQEREFLLSSLESFLNGKSLVDLDADERKEVEERLNKIVDDCMAVSVKVATNRSPREEEALDRVNVYINNLVVNVTKDPAVARGECIDALRAALQQKLDESGADDTRFADVHATCTLDDQRRTIRRLRGLMSYIQSLQQEAVEMLE